MTDCGIALIGQQFMGRAHSNGYQQAARFFDLPIQPRLEVVAANNRRSLEKFSKTWGWPRWTTDWKTIAKDDAVDLVDIATPNYLHAEQAIAMLRAGKHVACEKPLAGTLADARAMRDEAAKAKKSKTFVWFNYRRCPAVALARQLVHEGQLGQIYHVRATYLQSWGGPETPFAWRFDKKLAGSGAHGDLNAHIVDMARFILKDDIKEVTGAIAETFIKERKELTSAGKPTSRMKKSTVDDCVLFLARFRKGAVASFEATRVASGNLNANRFEINAEFGSLRFDLEDMNTLWYFENGHISRTSGWKRIMCTAKEHPYAGNWWPEGHIIGYEHTFANMAADMMVALAKEQPIVPLPDFADAYETQRVLEAAMVSAKERCAVPLSEIK